MGDSLDQKGADSFTTQARRFKAWEDCGPCYAISFSLVCEREDNSQVDSPELLRNVFVDYCS